MSGFYVLEAAVDTYWVAGLASRMDAYNPMPYIWHVAVYGSSAHLKNLHLLYVLLQQ